MLSQAIMFTALLGLEPPADVAAPADGLVCATAPPAPKRIDAQSFESTAADGTRSWGATATYRLSTDDLGEAFMVLDEDGSGEAQLMIAGEIIAHVAVTIDPASGQAVTTTWQPSEIRAAPEAIAEITRADLLVVVSGHLPQEFNCSRFGKKAMRVAGFLWRAGVGAAGGACCALTGPTIVGCAICGAASTTAIYEGGRVIDGHCD